MKKDKVVKELKVFGLAIIFAILASISSKYIPGEMITSNNLYLLSLAIGLIVMLQKESSSIKKEFGFLVLIGVELFIVAMLSLLLELLVSYTFLQLLAFFLYVYGMYKMFQALMYRN